MSWLNWANEKDESELTFWDKLNIDMQVEAAIEEHRKKMVSSGNHLEGEEEDGRGREDDRGGQL